MTELFNILGRLVAAPSASGNEGAAAETVRELVAPHADEIRTDAMGNLCALKRGAGGGKTVMLSAHLDTVGLIVTYIEESGFLRVSNVGGLRAAELPGTPVRFANGVRGVVAKEAGAAFKDLKLHDLYVDIGAKDRAEAEKSVRVSDVAVYATGTARAAGDCVLSPYLDDRLGCAVLVDVFLRLRDPANTVWCVFSAQEELGLRGAGAAAFELRPDLGLAVDVTGTGDTPEAKPKMACRVGGGAAIKVMDSSLVCDPALVRALEATAKARGIPHQFEVLERGGTDAGAIQRSRAGIAAGAVSIPTRHIHSPQELASLGDARAAANLVHALISEPIRL